VAAISVLRLYLSKRQTYIRQPDDSLAQRKINRPI
jgi:hypothetical protein